MPQPTPSVCLNGKFIGQPPTAVHKVGEELARAMVSRASGMDRHFIIPATVDVPSSCADLPIHRVGPLQGILWEQITLPRAARGLMLINLCNMTPLFVRHAMTMVHDAQVFTTPDSYRRSRRIWAQVHIRLAGRLQRGLLTVSEFAKSELVALGIAPASRIHVIYNGVDHILRVAADDTVRDRLALTPRGYALALANTMPHKNIGVLLRAFARPEMAGLTLVLAGKAQAADFTALGHPVPANVTFAGYVSDGEMRSLQAQALAVCTPSLTEGFGMPPVEGMLLGTPALIAPCGALPEVCGPDMPRADPHDPAAWAAALLDLQADPARWQDLSDRGRAFAAQFTWDAAAARLDNILRSGTI